MIRYKLSISYSGLNYSGFQIQKDIITVQSVLEDCLSKVICSKINLVASGRTDAGVSAIEQICHFDTEIELDTRRILGYVNSLLPDDIRVLNISNVDETFHARYSAKRKTYEYWFYISKEKIPVYDLFATHIGYNVDIDKMNLACDLFVGKHDFTAFCSTNTSVEDKTREIYNMSIKELSSNLYKLSITGNGFLYNMVRIIMGTLVEVGKGKISLDQIVNIIASKDRAKSGKTMPAKGLYLKKVEY